MGRVRTYHQWPGQCHNPFDCLHTSWNEELARTNALHGGVYNISFDEDMVQNSDEDL